MQYSIFQAPMYSFFNKDFYRSVGLKSSGTGFLYLFVLFIGCWSAIIISMYIHLIMLADNTEVVAFVDKLPNMTFKDGKMSMDKDSPYVVEIGDKKIIFDTSGKVKSMNDLEEGSALLTSDAIMFDTQKEPMQFEKFVKDYQLDHNQVKAGLKNICGYISLLGLALGLPVFFGHLFLALTYGVVGLVMDRRKLGFEAALRMAICAMTPGILISSLLSVCWINIPLLGLVTVPVTLGYLFFGYSSMNAPD